MIYLLLFPTSLLASGFPHSSYSKKNSTPSGGGVFLFHTREGRCEFRTHREISTSTIRYEYDATSTTSTAPTYLGASWKPRGLQGNRSKYSLSRSRKSQTAQRPRHIPSLRKEEESKTAQTKVCLALQGKPHAAKITSKPKHKQATPNQQSNNKKWQCILTNNAIYHKEESQISYIQ